MDNLPNNIPTLRILATVHDTNNAGDIFGGWLVSHADIAGAIEARKIAKGRVVTVAVNNFQFIKPVLINDLVNYYVETEKIGNTSITMKINVYVERETDARQIHEVAEARITYVAITDDRKTRPINR